MPHWAWTPSNRGVAGTSGGTAFEPFPSPRQPMAGVLDRRARREGARTRRRTRDRSPSLLSRPSQAAGAWLPRRFGRVRTGRGADGGLSACVRTCRPQAFTGRGPGQPLQLRIDVLPPICSTAPAAGPPGSRSRMKRPGFPSIRCTTRQARREVTGPFGGVSGEDMRRYLIPAASGRIAGRCGRHAAVLCETHVPVGSCGTICVCSPSGGASAHGGDNEFTV